MPLLPVRTRAVDTAPSEAPDSLAVVREGAGQGDLDAFGALVGEMYVPLCRMALRVTRSREMAEDAVQDVLLAYWERDRHKAIAFERSYLYRAVHNRALRLVESARRSVTVPIENAGPVADERPTISAGESVDDLEHALSRAVALLPERCRMAYILSREDGLTHAEIAQVMGVSIKTVEAQLCKSLARLREALSPYLG